MPRRIYTYDSGLGWDGAEPDRQHRLVRVRVRHAAHARELALEPAPRRRRAGADPWDADTLEWATTSPPPEYNFAAIPVVDEPPSAVGPAAAPGRGVRATIAATRALGVEGALDQETPSPRASTRRPEDDARDPADDLPAVRRSRSASRSSSSGCSSRPRSSASSASRRRRRRPAALDVADRRRTADERDRGRRPASRRPGRTHRAAGYATAWWGMVVLITTEAMIFLALLAAYFFLRAARRTWPPAASSCPKLAPRRRSSPSSCSAAASRSSGRSTRSRRGHMRQVRDRAARSAS